MGFKFETSILGGTFDHFHKGHEKLIEYGLSISERLIVAITSDEFIKNIKYRISNIEYANKGFQSFELRKKTVEDFLNKTASARFEIIKIDDLFGPTLKKDFKLDAIIASQETKNGALKINEERLRKGFKQFEIEICPDVLAEDGKLISSVRIRNGEIDREGKLFVNPKWYESDLEITDEIRNELKRPWGKLSKNIEALQDFTGLTIAVGDETSRVLNNLRISIDISVIDFKIAREKRFTDVKELGFSGDEEIVRVSNPAGIISKDLFKITSDIFKNSRKKRKIILIEGEDDLSVLPIILASPLGNRIFYGQPGEGIVEIEVTEGIKAKTHEIVSKFNTRGY